MLMLRRVGSYSLILIVLAVGVRAQQAPVAVESLGPQVGTTVPAFSGVDQFNRTQTLESVAGPAGAMLVFFRSADW
jgi:hypothetical protein